MSTFDVAGLIREAILRAHACGLTGEAFTRLLADVQADSKAWAEMSEPSGSDE